MTSKIPHYFSAHDVSGLPEIEDRHQFNHEAVRLSRNLGSAAGLQRLGLHLVRLAPGRESTTFHFHEADEEFLYILEGRGIADIGEHSVEVGPGDFMAFTAPSEPHMLKNTFDEDLVYLMGGEHHDVDVVHYPRIKRTMTKVRGVRSFADDKHWQDV